MRDHSDIPEFLKCPCGHCGNHLEFPREGVGLSVTCPHCSTETTLFDGAAPSVAVSETAVLRPESPPPAYQLPPLNLLRGPEAAGSAAQFQEELLTQARALQQMLAVFDIQVEIGELRRGPILTRFELQQGPG